LSDCHFCQKIQSIPTSTSGDLVWTFPNSHLFLGKWQFYHGYCVLVSKAHEKELFFLNDNTRKSFLEELNFSARAIFDAFLPAKMNYELLGNQVPHLHWHLFPRYKDDPQALSPVWLRLDQAEKVPSEHAIATTGKGTSEKTIQMIQAKLKQLGAPRG